MTIEHRTYPMHVERRQGDPPRLVGHAAVFDTLSEPMRGMREKIARGAFARSLREDDIRALWNHNPDYPLGRLKARTLRLREDSRGLAFEIDAPDTQAARDLLVSIGRGDVSQMSFGFVTRSQEWTEQGDMLIRTLLDVQLHEVSPVTFPAYPMTSVTVASSAKVGQSLAMRRRYQALAEATA